MIPRWLDTLLSSPSSRISSHYLAYKDWRWGDPHLHLLRHLYRSDKIAIDIGAHRGEYTYFLQRASRACIVFEPNPMLAEILRRRFPRGVVVLPHAVSDQRGVRILRIPIFDGEEHLSKATIDTANEFEQSRDITVDTVRLDDLALTDVGLLKIDVEGHEKSVLDGAIETIRREKPNLIVELEERYHPGITKQAADLLDDLGYRGVFLWNGKMLPQRLFKPEVHQKLYDGLPRAPYAWNFVFTTDDALLARISGWTR